MIYLDTENIKVSIANICEIENDLKSHKRIQYKQVQKR